MTEVKLKALIERVRSTWDASVTADLSHDSSVQLLFILTTLKPVTKVSELRVDMRYSMLGERCHAAHKRQMEHQNSAWNRIAEPVLGSGVNMTDEGIERIAIECGWKATWMTDQVTIYAKRRLANRRTCCFFCFAATSAQKAECPQTKKEECHQNNHLLPRFQPMRQLLEARWLAGRACPGRGKPRSTIGA